MRHHGMLRLLAALALLFSGLLPARAALPEGLLPSPHDPATLLAFFRQGEPSFDVFCKATDSCRPLTEKQALFTLFFRGSLARSATAPADNDPVSAYAEQAAAYFTEPGYRCRRPFTARVLENLWQMAEAPDNCPDALPFLVSSEEGSRLRQLPTERVTAVHLLFAGAHGHTMSRFGHIGLRLVTCTASRTTPGPDCDEDLPDHLALGFRAAIDELGLSYWKGLTGGYRLRLYASPFLDSYQQYTQAEFRPLYSLPLEMDAPSRKLLLQALAETHWAYQHDYRFFSQNCASELSWLLRTVGMVSGDESRWLHGGNIRPDRLFQKARSSPGFTAQVLDDPARAEQAGFFFPDSRPYYQQALDTVQAQLPPASAPSFAKLQQLEARDRRQRLYEPALAAAADDSRARTARAALVLEAWMEYRLRREVRAMLGQHYLLLTRRLLEETDLFPAEEASLLQQCLDGFRQSSQLGQHQGLPDNLTLPANHCDTGSPLLRQALTRLIGLKALATAQQQQLDELETTTRTMAWLLPQSISPLSLTTPLRMTP